MKIAVMGTGGTGGYYGGLLAKQGHDVTFIARGAHLEAIRKNGLQVQSIHGDFTVKPASATDRPGEIAPVDLILFCTKTYDTDEAAEAIKPLVEKGGAATSVLSVQNGIDAVERIGAVVGPEHMLAAATWISSAVAGPGLIKQVSEFRRLVLGEPGGPVTLRAQAVYEALKGTGIAAELSDDILKVLWTKFVFISAASAFGSLTRLPLGGYRAVPETRALILRLMREVEELAQAEGVNLDKDVVDSSIAFMDKNAPHIKASMQLDVETGHRTELESMLGAIGRKGRQKGVQTPLADVFYGLLLPVERAARGN